MLGVARQQILQEDVVIGVVETHGRMETEVMTDGMNGFRCGTFPTATTSGRNLTWIVRWPANRHLS